MARVGLFLLLIVCSAGVTAQPQATRMFKKYSTKDGLLNNGIYSLHQSKSGLWWIGTGIGLQRFDGYTFETWNEPADSTNTADFGAQNVYEDSQSNVWVFNFKAHYVFPAASKRFVSVTTDSSKGLPPVDYYPVPVMERGGKLWCFQNNTGFFGLNMQTQKADTLVSVTFGPWVNENYATLPFVAADETGTAWVVQDFADSSYVIRFSPGEAIQTTVLPANRYGQVKAYIPVGDNQFLFVSTKYTALCTGSDLEHPIHILSRENVPGNFVRGLPFEKLKINNKGSVIFPGEKGIYEYVPSTKSLQLYSTAAYPGINLTRQLMFALKEDQQGNIWIGRDGSDGLLVFHPSKLKFDFLQAPLEYFNLVYSLAVDANGNVLASGFQKGLNVFDKQGKWQRYIDLPKIENGMPPSIRAMGFIDKDHLVMKSLEDKLMILHTDDYRLLDISSLFPNRAAQQKNVFDANFVNVREGELHFTHGNYVLSIVKTDNSYSVTILDSLFQETAVTSIAYSSSGKRTVGTSNGCYTREGNAWRKVAGSADFPVKFVTVDKEDLIWATGSRGILVIRENEVIKRYNESTGLLNEFVYGVLFDEAGNAWYSSNRGLGCVQKDGSMKFLTEADGLQGDEFDTQSFWKAADGKLFFGGINGISAFYPDKALQSSLPGNIVLSGLTVNGDHFPQEGRLEHLSALPLSHDQNSLTFAFTLSDFSDPSYNVYKVRMDGFDKDWVNLKNINAIRYLLGPGQYRFFVKGSSDGSTWSAAFSLPIVIHPPWWKTAWFTWAAGLLGLALLAALGFYYNRRKTFQLRQQLQLQLEMQKERERISRDLHDNIGAYSTAMIANTEALEQSIHDPEGMVRLSYLKENARTILSTIRETIWLLNSANLTVSGFTEGLINYATNILRNYEGVEIEFKEEITVNKKLPPVTAINLLRILQEVIQNIVKHSRATKINCYVKSNHLVEITITDNGVGFDGTQVTGNGLRNMKHRAQEIHFELHVVSRAGQGTEVSLTGRI